MSQEAKLPALPPECPQIEGQTAIRCVGHSLVACSRWRVQGPFPKVSRLVAIAAPHSSNWDGVYGIAAAYAIGIRATWMGKDSLFRFGLGGLMRGLGGIPTDRSNPRGAVGQMVELLRTREKIWLFLAPEGTRKPVRKWRSGFWHIAEEAQVPILPVYIDFPSRTFGLLPLVHPSGDKDADLDRIYALYSPFRGKDGKDPLPPAVRERLSGRGGEAACLGSAAMEGTEHEGTRARGHEGT